MQKNKIKKNSGRGSDEQYIGIKKSHVLVNQNNENDECKMEDNDTNTNNSQNAKETTVVKLDFSKMPEISNDIPNSNNEVNDDEWGD